MNIQKVGITDNELSVDYMIEYEDFSFVITFAKPEFLQERMKQYKASGECLNGKYFWADNFIWTTNLDEYTVKEIIIDIIKEGEIGSFTA